MALYNCKVQRKVFQGGSAVDDAPTPRLETVESRELVPGDLIIIPEATTLPCDLILLTGGAIINEAMLTGESVPVLKTSLPVSSEDLFSSKDSEKHILHGGT